MTPEQALEVLDQAAAAAQMNRQDHLTVMEALRVLRDLIGEGS